MGYVKFTEEKRNRARETNLADFLTEHGETVKKSGSEFVWLDGSQKVSINGCLWFHQYDRQGGNAVQFVQRFYGKSYPEAVQMLLGGSAGQVISKPQPQTENHFELPLRNDNMNRMFAYLLMTRGLEKEIVQEFVRKNMLYESAKYHNAVFIARELKLSESTVRRAIRDLRKAKLLETEQRYREKGGTSTLLFKLKKLA